MTTIAKGGGGDANNIGPQYYDGAMLANDGEYAAYGGLLLNTAAYTLPGPHDVELYDAFWYGAPRDNFAPGFVDAPLPSNVTRYVTAGAGVSVPSENKGFYFSGLRSASSRPIFALSGNESTNADVVSNTLISVDLSQQRSESWANNTLPADVPGRANAELAWVPVSTQGLLVAIGGSVDPEFAYANLSLTDAQKAQDVSMALRARPHELTAFLAATTQPRPDEHRVDI
jgi:hypothetical protein